MKISRLLRKTIFLLIVGLGSLFLVFVYKENSPQGFVRNFMRLHKTFKDVDSIRTFRFEATKFQAVNILLLVTSFEDTRHLSLQLKSVLFYRSSPVFLHLFVSTDVLERIVFTLLSSWHAEQVLFKIYRISPEAVPTNIPHLLDCIRQHVPRSSKEAVFMSSNILFTADVSLWLERTSSASDGNVALHDGTVCASPGSCHGRPNLMYINLNGITEQQQSNESLIGKTPTLPCSLAPLRADPKNLRPECFPSSFTDMERILVVTRSDFHSDRYRENPLHQSISESVMLVDSSPPKVWPLSTGRSFYGGQHFKSFVDSLRAANDSEFHSMSGSGRTQITNKTRECRFFLNIAHLKRRTHLFYHLGGQWLKKDATSQSTLSPIEDIDVTLLTALSIDRFPSLELVLDHWSGPVAILFYLSDSDASLRLPRLLGESKAMRKVKERAVIHLVYQRLPYNPLNYLRNVLLNNTHSSHALYLDVDLLPNPDLHENIIKHLIENGSSPDDKKLYIVAAFQSFIRLDKNLPKKKKDLLKLLEDQTVTGYKQKTGWSLGHRPTNYNQWIKADEPYRAAFKDAFEPYVVVPRNLGAYFNEDLLERMGDKIAYTRLIHAMGYDYYVLPNDFIVHLPHPTSSGLVNYFTEPNLFKCGSILFEEYRKKLYEMFPNRKF